MPSAEGQPRLGPGSRTTHCKKRGSKRGLSRRENGQKPCKMRSSLLAPFRADRATAASDIVHHVADDDLRRSSAAAARKMSVYVWSAFLAGTRFRAKIAPSVARFGRDPPSHHGACARGLVAENRRPKRPNARQAQLSQPGRSWGPPQSFAAGSSARRLVERNGARQRRAAQASAAHPRGRPFLK